jgi:hypothetical protein
MRQRRGLYILGALLVAGILASAVALAAAAKTYQVTGPVLEVNKDMIVVQKGKDRWEIARDASSKVPSDVKVGDKVTIHYRMTATEVEAKAAAKKTESKKGKK